MAGSLRGSAEHNIDEKGRIVVPAKMREALGDRFVITRGMNNTIILCPEEYFKYMEKEALKMPMNSPFRVFFIGSACDAEVDKQGRIVIPPKLRKHAQLEKECTYAGAIEYVQLWSTKRYDEYLEQLDTASIEDELLKMSQQRREELNRQERDAKEEPEHGI